MRLAHAVCVPFLAYLGRFPSPSDPETIQNNESRFSEKASTANTANTAMSTKVLSGADKLRNWWTGCSNEGLRLAERTWFASAVRTPTTVTDVNIGGGQFLHTLSVAASPAAPASSRPLVVLHGYGQGIGVWAKAVDPLHKGLGPDHAGIHQRF